MRRSDKRRQEIAAGVDLLTRTWELPQDRTGVLEGLWEIDRKLVVKSFPALSDWWRSTIQRWWLSGKRTCVLRVGRGGGKSSSLSRLAVAVALYEDHSDIAPGDTPTVAIVSVDRREASRRLVTVKAILDALGEAYRPIDGGILITRVNVAVQVFTATIAGVSGFTSIFVLGDEVAKWRDADTGANPATEVLASIRPTFRGRPKARMALSSSPMGELDAHADAFREGETGGQCVAHATSFEANPTISEAQTKLDEPDEGKWRREYLAIPLEGTEESLYSPHLLARCTRNSGDIEPQPGWSYVAAADLGTRGNSWTLAVATTDHAGKTIVVMVEEWRGSQSAPLDPDTVFPEVAGLLAPYKVRVVEADAYGTDFAASCARRVGLVLEQKTLSAPTRLTMHEEIVKRMAAGEVELHPEPNVRKDLLGVQRILSRSGQTLSLATTPDGRHSDFAPTMGLVLSAHCPRPEEILMREDEEERDSLERDVARFAPRKTNERPLPGAPTPQRAWWERGKRRAPKRTT